MSSSKDAEVLACLCTEALCLAAHCATSACWEGWDMSICANKKKKPRTISYGSFACGVYIVLVVWFRLHYSRVKQSQRRVSANSALVSDVAVKFPHGDCARHAWASRPCGLS